MFSFSGGVGLKHHKLFSRFALIVGFGLCGILYLAWELPSLELPQRVQNLWKQPPRRLIVFGDSWSDNGQYLIDQPTEALLPSREEAQGRVWTEWLCLFIACSQHDNFARSLPSSSGSGYINPMIDSSLLQNISHSENEGAQPLADLKTQVAHWIRFERERYPMGHPRDLERNGTIFTIWFSLWDLWYFSKGTKDEASEAVKRTMDTLFEQLDVIAEQWSSHVKVIIPEAIDPTFLPGWQAMRTGPFGSDQKADEQRNAVRLVEQWNKVLADRVFTWERGDVHISSTNEWLLDQVREQQLIVGALSDSNGLGTNGSPWINVQSGCIRTTHHDRSPELEKTHSGKDRCAEPHKYLFWDDMHLGPEAMKMMGEGISQDIMTSGGHLWGV